ncbi:hypothetical protein ASPWEDRAFT_44868 [Aspergillus wentii DTO 134E9]|uniref:Uncharacterized protein n=1 Tax=Aspergillus wentii DTO 134E9 TaxID=1073089 RepID=A0A1L9R7I9_ASPWE|nr:uncharacterized protein ASPWEDRAFT_44868 [Aspergillus wentii DTO 134E9]OJJ30895.1 hypothetical protein ASPWEDRAFT_44868 [Aspergillus wentii DTO 134E9]
MNPAKKWARSWSPTLPRNWNDRFGLPSADWLIDRFLSQHWTFSATQLPDAEALGAPAQS